MNLSQTNTANMFARMNLFFKKYTVTLQPFTMLWNFITAFQDGFKPLNAYISQQQTSSGGQTTNKTIAWQTLVNSLVPLARKAMVWAQSVNDNVLVKLFDVSEHDFKIPDKEVLSFAGKIIDGLNNNIAALAAVNIQQVQVDAAQKNAQIFDGLIGTPQQAQKVAVVGTGGLLKVINSENELLHNIDNLLIPEFTDSEADMVNEYKANRKVGEVHHLHTKITVHIYSDAAHTLPVTGATFTIPSLGKSAVTDMNGTAMIEEFKGGELSGLLTAPGYKDLNFNFEIANGQQMDLAEVMVV